jgi:hypothetical protein
MEEVDAATQAEMAIRLSDNVRDLVRQHVLEAFNDYEFMYNLPIDFLHPKIENRNYGGIGFAQAVRDVIRAQMSK